MESGQVIPGWKISCRRDRSSSITAGRPHFVGVGVRRGARRLRQPFRKKVRELSEQNLPSRPFPKAHQTQANLSLRAANQPTAPTKSTPCHPTKQQNPAAGPISSRPRVRVEVLDAEESVSNGDELIELKLKMEPSAPILYDDIHHRKCVLEMTRPARNRRASHSRDEEVESPTMA